MQRLVLTALLMVMVAALSPASGQTGKSAGEQEAQRFVDAFASGLEHNDAAAVDRLLAPECWCCDEARGSGSWSPHRPVKSVRRGCLASGRRLPRERRRRPAERALAVERGQRLR